MFDMMQELLLPVLDGMVLVALGVTGFFVFRLTLQVRGLRQGRADMDRHLAELGSAAARAELALSVLRKAADETGRRLEGQVTDAREILEEMRFMAEAGDRIAARLEKGSVQARQSLEIRGGGVLDLSEPAHGEKIPFPQQTHGERPSVREGAPSQPAGSGDNSVRAMEERIRARARDFLDKLSAKQPVTADGADAAALQGLRSQAERDLAHALRMRRAP